MSKVTYEEFVDYYDRAFSGELGIIKENTKCYLNGMYLYKLAEEAEEIDSDYSNDNIGFGIEYEDEYELSLKLAKFLTEQSEGYFTLGAGVSIRIHFVECQLNSNKDKLTIYAELLLENENDTKDMFGFLNKIFDYKFDFTVNLTQKYIVIDNKTYNILFLEDIDDLDIIFSKDDKYKCLEKLYNSYLYDDLSRNMED